MHPQYAATPTTLSLDEHNLPLWERTMRTAMSSARAGQWRTAADGFCRALDIARQLIDNPPLSRVDDCVAALVVSFHNLADAQIELGYPEQVVKLLCDAHEMLIAIHLEHSRPPALRATALRHTRETHMALISHAKDHGMHPLCARTLELARQALEPQRSRPAH